jgi:hypothetical protein
MRGARGRLLHFSLPVVGLEAAPMAASTAACPRWADLVGLAVVACPWWADLVGAADPRRGGRARDTHVGEQGRNLIGCTCHYPCWRFMLAQMDLSDTL